MARRPRIVVPGQPHHVLQRGHNGQPVFADADDRRFYLDALAAAAAAEQVQLHAYALLPAHVQLLVTPPAAHSLSSMMQAIGRRYVARYNQRHGRSGTLWEGRFRAALVEADAYFLACQRYIESGLPDEGLASALLDPLYSSLAHHLGKARNPLLTDHAAYWALGNTPFEREHAYRRWLDEGVGEAERARIADAVSYGWALARPEYLARPWAAALDAPLVRRLPGRPRKSPAT